MPECPQCQMRDDDWFLCRRDNCAVKAELIKLANEYRPTMHQDILHSWAIDVVAKIRATIDSN